MKSKLTREESRHLISLGVPREKASKVEWARIRDSRGDKIPEEEQLRGVDDKPFSAQTVGFISYSTDDIFALDDFLNGEILPKEIEINEIDWGLFFAWDYTRKVHIVGYNNRNSFYSKELIDALYELACWYYGEYLKSEKK